MKKFHVQNPSLASQRDMRSQQLDDIQKQIQRDWQHREYIEVVTSSMKKIADFLNSFELSSRSRLANLNEKLTNLERRIEYVEALVTAEDQSRRSE